MSDASATEAAPQWAVIELMGHVRYGALGTAMLRVADREASRRPAARRLRVERRARSGGGREP